MNLPSWISLLLISACSSDSTSHAPASGTSSAPATPATKPPAPSAPAPQRIKLKVDGKDLGFTSVSAFRSRGLTIAGDITQPTGLHIMIDSPFEVSKPIAFAGSDKLTLSYTGKEYVIDAKTGKGSVTVTEIAPDLKPPPVRGTFEGTAVASDGSKVEITDGTFNGY